MSGNMFKNSSSAFCYCHSKDFGSTKVLADTYAAKLAHV